MTGKVIITGGTGFLGSHTAVVLLEAGYQPILVDNFHNSFPAVLSHLQLLNTNQPPIEFHQLDLESDAAGWEKLLSSHVDLRRGECGITAVIHFAGRKSAPESVTHPLEYYSTNVKSLLTVLTGVQHFQIPHFIYSSSAAVYAESEGCAEDGSAALQHPLLTPYGTSKLMGERIVEDLCRSSRLKALSLRYFNPIGAHPSGLLGEAPRQVTANLLPLISDLATHRRTEPLIIHGHDYPNSPDGTPVRDYLHVMDVAQGHLKALEYLRAGEAAASSYDVVNLGSGKGYSVLEVLQTFTRVTGANVSFRLGSRRPREAGRLVAQIEKAQRILHWQPTLSLEQACRDLWKWQQRQNKS